MVHTEKLIPLTTVFLQKATAPHIEKKKKSPSFHANRRLITVITTARHMSLSRSIQTKPAPSTSTRSVLILPYHLFLGFPSAFILLEFITLTYSMVERTRNLVAHGDAREGK